MSSARDRGGSVRRQLGLIALMLIGSSAVTRSGLSQLPLDPLTPREAELAQRLARADGRVRELVGQRRSVIGATWFLALKPDTVDVARDRQRDSEPIRAAMVLFYVYDGDYGVRGLVDLGRSTVLKVDRLDNEPIPFAEEEIAAAQRLALREPRLREALGTGAGESRVEYLGVTPVDERDPCFRHRCVQLLFRRGRAFLMRPIVIVDLTTQTVRLEEPPR